ncbi:MAG: FeoB-associated Cys-rich membrane protein [Clostridia bacterium]|nr:FeoB-associated Cys-rich membrane protein [Clostridia bacterium]
MEDVIITIILLLIAAGIIWYLVRAKKRGDKCVGCPHAKQCKSACQCNKK